MNIRKLHRGKGRIRCEIQPTFFWCSFLRIKKEGQGFLPGMYEKENLCEKVVGLCLIITIQKNCEETVLKKQKNYEDNLKK